MVLPQPRLRGSRSFRRSCDSGRVQDGELGDHVSRPRSKIGLIAAQLVVAGCWIATSVRVRLAPALAAATSVAATTSGCASVVERLRSVTRNGQSAIEARGELTGRSKGVGLTRYVEMRLTRVQTLHGKKLPNSLSGWIESSPEPAPSAADAPGLWGPDVGFVSIVTSRQLARAPVGAQRTSTCSARKCSASRRSSRATSSSIRRDAGRIHH
jgi:hypothetical protein